MATVLQNIKRKRQKFAWDKVNEVISKQKEYKSLVEEIGMMIYSNGLISTLAFLKGKGGVHKDLYSHIAKWLEEDNIIPFKLDTNEDLLEKAISIEDARQLMLLTKEILVLSDAFKEMVKAK